MSKFVTNFFIKNYLIVLYKQGEEALLGESRHPKPTPSAARPLGAHFRPTFKNQPTARRARHPTFENAPKRRKFPISRARTTSRCRCSSIPQGRAHASGSGRRGGEGEPRRRRRDGVEDGVQGHHHAAGLRRHRRRVLRLRGEQHPVQPRGIPGGELRQGEEVRADHAAHAGRGGQGLRRQPHLPALRVARGRKAPADRSGDYEQGHLRGAGALELQHRDRRRGRRERGEQGEERQGDHEGDPGHHAPGRLLHHLPPLPRRAMHIRRAGLHRRGCRRADHLGRERRQAHQQPADGEAAFVRHQDPQGGHARLLQERRLGRAVAATRPLLLASSLA